ncbi:polysaccharide biosynthesis/export family protein [Tunturiibacter gelidiferens]|uniref:polysaccharide biosynthesis/export family protein n=1 Tax=Tunturiibacter gelidiferens TaxID=3069689 RepID=UPI003D9B5C43
MRQNKEGLRTEAEKCVDQVDWRRAWLASAIFLLMALCGGVAEAQFSGPALGITSEVNPPITITTDPAILFPGPRDVFLGVGDVFSIRIFGNGDYTPAVRIGLDGTVQLPLIGSVLVNDLTVHQAQDLIAQKLKDAGMFRDPQVAIQITDSPNQIVTVLGELHGIVPVIGERRLFDVLAAVGSGAGGGGAAGNGVGQRRLSSVGAACPRRQAISSRSIVMAQQNPSSSTSAPIPRRVRSSIYRSIRATRLSFHGLEWSIC